jgi:hypothetical protein
MPRFYLHIDNGHERIEDEEGSELPDFEALREEALASARQLWAAAILKQTDLSHQAFTVTDEGGQEIAQIGFLEAGHPQKPSL